MSILFYFALILFSGLIFGRAVKLIKLPNVTGYLIAGLLLGPFVLNVVPQNVVTDLSSVSEIALAFIAFSIGAEFKLEYLKKVGMMPIIIALFEAFIAMIFVTVGLLLIGCDTNVALLLGAIASATAPAATVMVVKQYRAKGPVTNTLLSVVALDDAVALIAFGIAMAIVNARTNPGQASTVMTIVMPFVEIIGSMVIGAVLGFLFNFPLRFFKKNSNRLIITLGFIFLGSSLATIWGLSPLLLCMSMGAVVVNTCKDGLSLLGLIDNVTPPIFLMFFFLSGAQLDITILPSIGLIGIVYIVFRILGKVFGASIGAVVAKAPDVVKKYVGLTLIPQAGVAIGLSLVASEALPQYGGVIRAVVLSSTLINELIGPVMTKVGLKKAGEIAEQ